jgi:hypothetical protein
MKKILFLTLILNFNTWAQDRVLLNDQSWMNADVNATTVLCSARGYGLEELKINIKSLDGWTLLDHSNLRFGSESRLPCMTAGACKSPISGNTTGFSIDDVIRNNPRSEKILVKRQVIESRSLSNRDNETFCSRSLTEKLDTIIGGIPFHHQRSINTGEKLPASECSL